MIINLFQIITVAISSFPFLLTINLSAFLLKAFLLTYVFVTGLKSSKVLRSWFFLIPVLVGALFADFSWVVSILHKTYFPQIDYTFIIFIVRLAWAFFIIQHQALALFIESLTEKDFYLKTHQKISLGISTILCIMVLSISIIKFDSAFNRPPFELALLKICSLYEFILMVPVLLYVLHVIRSKNIPKILKKQLKILIQYFIAPVLLSDFLQNYPFSMITAEIANNYAVVGISTTLLTFTLFYTARKMMGLRFLNFHSHVQSKILFNFIDDFKNVLEQLSHVTNVKELGHVTQAFFKSAFNVQPSRTILHIRKLNAFQTSEEIEIPIGSTEAIVESFISKHDTATSKFGAFLRQSKILITDEIEFNDFCNSTEETVELKAFLNHIDADIFIPIYEKQTIIAYITADRNARLTEELYSDIERDEMVVFASYLGNIINLLQNRNLNTMIYKEKEIKEELYRKHKEIEQYKESIRSFLRSTKNREIGILFYKNRRFTFANQSAKKLISININTQVGHPLAKSLNQLIHNVYSYKTNQTIFAKDAEGNKLVLLGIPNLEQNNIIVAAYYPEIGDIIKGQTDVLKNPSEWDYLLYLETTQSGKLINQLIPGSGEHLLNFKIELLKISLSKKALLLELQEEDLAETVEILHHISLRETLHILKLQNKEKDNKTAIKLFGINPIFEKTTEPSLLEKLNNTGTLFIENIHFLDLETQHYLAEFLRYGFYHIFKSDKKITANVRIICSTNQNLQTLVQEGKFAKSLFNELKQTTLSMPPLVTLPQEELNELAEGFTKQAIQTDAFANLLELTKKDKDKLIHAKPVSLKEFKNKVLTVLHQKSKKNQIFQEIQFDPAYNISDPELVHAARLGRKALKDPKILAMLVNKLKNQNAIASFLGVNRSSVNRRCKEYNIS